ncbi:hypothetical protein WJX74_002956 [Apatococcus lobatus]|uniref:CNNM transmembrane domain-containing protein n=1 Tax=Apatococcus lobatus TaxID=904363 RepID=A0AAW1RZE1_9CHLO
MSLDHVDLEVLKRSGTPLEKKQAARIAPVLEKPHLLLVTLLVCNSAAMESLPIFLDRVVSPLTAVILSVTAILIFGEIVPQALCTRFGLAIGAYSAWFVQLLIYACWIIAWPISKILDYVLGDQHSALFRRGQLKALVDVHSQAEGLGGNLSMEEISIIRGALDLTSKIAIAGMTPLEKVFTLCVDDTLDETTLKQVLASGHSRTKVSNIRIRNLPFLRADTPMYDLLKVFQTGRSHMLVLTRHPNMDEDLLAQPPDSPHENDNHPSSDQGPQENGKVTEDHSKQQSSDIVAEEPGTPRQIRLQRDLPSPVHERQLSTEADRAGSPPAVAERSRSLPNQLADEGVSGHAAHTNIQSAGSGSIRFTITPDSTGANFGGRRQSDTVQSENDGRRGVFSEDGGQRELAEPIGIITIEDVVEELIQQEIVDETDQFIDNLRSEKVNAHSMVKSLPPQLRKLLMARDGSFRSRTERVAVTAAYALSEGGSGRLRRMATEGGNRIQEAMDVLQPLLNLRPSANSGRDIPVPTERHNQLGGYRAILTRSWFNAGLPDLTALFPPATYCWIHSGYLQLSTTWPGYWQQQQRLALSILICAIPLNCTQLLKEPELSMSRAKWVPSRSLLQSINSTLLDPASSEPADDPRPADAQHPPSTTSQRYILVMKDNSCVNQLRALRLLHRPSQQPSRTVTFLAGRTMPPGCNLTGLPTCKHVFGASITGCSADMTSSQLQQIKLCFAQELAYIEPDGLVEKMEGPRALDSFTPHRHWRAAGRRLAQVESADDMTPDGSKENTNNTQLRSLAGQLTMDAGDAMAAGFDTSQLLSTSGLAGIVNVSSSAQIFQAGIKTQKLHTAQWGLDRIDQRSLPLDGTYRLGTSNSTGTGRGVTIYTLDSGVRPSHQEFMLWDSSNTRASFGTDFVNNSASAADCEGHGTHVASTAVGRTVGVVKESKIVAIRVLDCYGSGSVSSVVAGLDWIASNAQPPAIVTLSLGISKGSASQSLEQAVSSLIQNFNVTVIAASGNTNGDSCQEAPADVRSAIAVGASDLSFKFDASQGTQNMDEPIYPYTNTGACLDIFAPGVNILAACGSQNRCDILNDTAYAWASGTSMAVPHVAGVVAVYLSANPTATPAQVKAALIQAATTGVLNEDSFLPGTPNRLLFSDLSSIRFADAASSPAQPPSQALPVGQVIEASEPAG